ncbi:3-dehydroquinate synthase [Segetibacter aerophilus]|uniref:3-dehydroquinate synthase n=1 Tax=Segetibacter aerophilus TaxID=670293 RepID=A0A512B8V7_9BACT|nr:3-dehydroquinate synthase [Segetibacter aerophilus]GEO08404.1 3-dehydroquinate synthase [Segetibacter aerophilus]
MHDYLEQSFSVKFEYRVHFTSGLFDTTNTLLEDFFKERQIEGMQQKILFVLDEGVAQSHPGLVDKINAYFDHFKTVKLAENIVLVPGGEKVKNHSYYNEFLINTVNDFGIDRHSYLAAIGGGSVLDMAGLSAAVAHRGVKHIRIPTTVLSQNDSGVGVKNGVNFKNKKNFMGTFAPPVAVFNDDQFLTTLTDRDWRSGMSEAVKVALIKDAEFFNWLELHAFDLSKRDLPTMNYLIKRCAELHLQHIRSGDPFETGSARPLDFGHWSAHKLEQLTNFEVMHGEAVAMGIALDSVYSGLKGDISADEVRRIINLLINLGFDITHPMMEVHEENSPLLLGLDEFREHLGGRLTITLLTAIGKGKEVNEMDWHLVKKASEQLKALNLEKA